MSDIEKTLESRLKTHGEYENYCRVVQGLKDVVKQSPNYENMSCVHKETLDMIFSKVARICCGNPDHLDHPHDIAGYASLLEKHLKDNNLEI